MIKHLFSHVPDVNVFVKLTRDGKSTELVPDKQNGWLGCFKHQDKITFTVSVTPGKNHSCSTLDPKHEKTPRKAIGEGTYEKVLTVTLNREKGVGQIAPWPSNLLCLDVEDKHYNIGIFVQNGIFYLVTEEYVPDDSEKSFAADHVRWFSLLRGIGSVSSKDPICDYRIHHTAAPRQSNHLRCLETDDKLNITEIVETKLNTNFREEIKSCTLAQ